MLLASQVLSSLSPCTGLSMSNLRGLNRNYFYVARLRLRAFASASIAQQSQSTSTEVGLDHTPLGSITKNKSAQRAIKRAKNPKRRKLGTLHDLPMIRRPGDLIPIGLLIRNWWSTPAVGFNSILQIPIHQFEIWDDDTGTTDRYIERVANAALENQNFESEPITAAESQSQGQSSDSKSQTAEEIFKSQPRNPKSASVAVHNHLVSNTGIVISRDLSSVLGEAIVPNDVFGMPLRKDLIYRAYWFYRKALAGYDKQMQYNKWEWPCSNRKIRTQIRSGKARMSRRCAHLAWEGSFVHPIRPKDWRVKLNRRMLWGATKAMLSVKFAQGEIKLVDSFNVTSHKTKHVVQCFRRLVGDRCNSALCVHEGTRDVNDAFRWATGHVSAIRRCNVEGLDVYKLLKFKYLIITETALQKLVYNLQTYPEKRRWKPSCATPDGRPAPRPEKVPGWNDVWKEKKERLRNSEFRAKLYGAERKKWKWSNELYGPLKLKIDDPLRKFRLMNFGVTQNSSWEKLEDIYLDDEALGTQLDDEDLDFRIESNRDSESEISDESSVTELEHHSGSGPLTGSLNPSFLSSKAAVADIQLSSGRYSGP